MEEVIKLELEILYKKYEECSSQEQEAKEKIFMRQKNIINEFLDDLEKDIENINYLETDSIVPLIYPSELQAEVKEQIRLIKIVLEAKNEKHFPVEMSESQNFFLKNFINRLKEKEEQLASEIQELQKISSEKNRQKEELETQIINLETLLEKLLDIENVELLNQSDFQTLYICIAEDSIPYDKRRLAILDFKTYNDKRIYYGKKVIEQVDIEVVKKCFQEFGLLDTMEKYLTKYEKEIVYRADIYNIKSILEYLQTEDLAHNKPNLLTRFEPFNLLTICIYGTPNSVKSRYEKLRQNVELYDVYFTTPSVWIRNISKQKSAKENQENDAETKGKTMLLAKAAYQISYEEMKENERFLQELGFDVSLARAKNITTIKTPHKKLLENLQILTQYQIYDESNKNSFPVSTLAFSDLITKCDSAIEVELLNPMNKEHGNYLKKYPSKIQMVKKEYIASLYKLKGESSFDIYNENVYAKKEPEKLNSEFVSDGFRKLAHGKSLDEFVKNNFINFSTSKYLPNYKKYKAIITKNFAISFNKDILNDPLIQNLETYHHVIGHDLQYVFGTVIISRLKVLRIYSILKKNHVENLEEALLFAITYNSLLNEESLDLIFATLKFGREEKEYGLS